MLHFAVSSVEGIGFGSGGQIDDRLRQRQIAFRHANEINRIAGCHTQCECVRVSETDVLDRHAHDATRNVKRIFASFKHAAEPVQSGIGIAVAN